MNDGLTHPDILTVMRCGELPRKSYPKVVITCDCGREITVGSGEAYYLFPDGAIACRECIADCISNYEYTA